MRAEGQPEATGSRCEDCRRTAAEVVRAQPACLLFRAPWMRRGNVNDLAPPAVHIICRLSEVCLVNQTFMIDDSMTVKARTNVLGWCSFCDNSARRSTTRSR